METVHYLHVHLHTIVLVLSTFQESPSFLPVGCQAVLHNICYNAPK